MKEIDFSNARRNFKREEKKKYDMKREKDSATIAKLIYKNEKEFRKEIEGMGYKFIKFFDCDKDDTQAAIIENEEGQILVFRGSESFKDWVKDLSFWLVDTEIGKIHYGVWSIIDHHFDEICKYITDKNIVVTAHSLGAGLSLCFTALYFKRKDLVIPCIAFEPLRITDNKELVPWALYTVNASDMVCRLPFGLLGYHLTGRMVYFTSFGKFKYEPRLIKRMMDFLADSIGDSLPKRAVEMEQDHSMYSVESLWLKHWDKIKLKV